jgi:hypothetical protein
MKNVLKEKLSVKKFLLGVFILFFLLAVGGLAKISWQSFKLSGQNITILAPGAIAQEGRARLEISVWDFKKNQKVEAGQVKIELLDAEGKGLGEIYEGELDDGAASPEIVLPKLDPGKYGLKVFVKTKIGKDELLRDIEIKNPARLFISTDKPLYKPGQMMNFRVMALNADLVPSPGIQITVEVENPKKDTIYRKILTASDYGIVSAQFPFADELAFGDYVLTASYDGQTSKKTVSVKQYTLPTYEVIIKTNENISQKPNLISGTVEARYFFGKPVENGQVELKIKHGENSVLKGKLDENGAFAFEFKPLYRPDLDAINFNAEVLSQSHEKISAEKNYNISESGISIDLIPESGILKPGLDNRILFISSNSDGVPIKTSVFMTGERLREFSTDEFGLAYFNYRPEPGAKNSIFNLNVRDENGNAVVKKFELQNEINPKGHLIIRPSKTVLKPQDLL